MTKYYVSSNNSILEFQTIGNCQIYATQFLVDQKSRKLKKGSEFSWKCKQKVEILKATSVLETLTAKTIPVILVIVGKQPNSGQDVTCYLLSVLEKQEKFVALRKYTVDSKTLIVDKSHCVHVRIIDGPSLFISCGTNLIMCYNDSHCSLKECKFSLTTLNRTTKSCCDAAQTKIVSTTEILNLTNVENQNVIVGLSTIKEKCPTHKKRTCKDIFIIKFCNKTFSQLDTRNFIPPEYSETISCLHIQNLILKGKNQHTSKIYAGTEDGFVLFVEDGKLLKCIQVFSSVAERPSAITSIYSSISLEPHHEQRVLVCQSENITSLNTQFEEEKSFLGIKHVFPGDFVGDGSTQYLLMKETFSVTSPWILTDLDTYCVHHDDEAATTTTSESSCSTETAVQALQARLQREKHMLDNDQHLYEEKIKFVSSMYTQQLTLAQGIQSSSQQYKADLVPLITGQPIQDVTTSASLYCPIRVKIQSCDLWQKTYNRKWCIAVDITGHTDRAIQAWLQVISPTTTGFQSSFTSTCKPVNIYPQSNSATSNQNQQEMFSLGAKRAKKEDQSKKHFDITMVSENDNSKDGFHETLSCVMSVPTFSLSDSHTMCVMLQWRDLSADHKIKADDTLTGSQSSAKEQQSEQENDNDRIYSVYCGQVQLTCADMVGGVYEINLNRQCGAGDTVMEDLENFHHSCVAWQQLQTQQHLVVKSSPGILASLDTLLVERCNYGYNTQYSCYVTDIPLLSNIQLKLGQQQTSDRRILDVYTSSEQDVLLLIHHLYNKLPDHVIILPQEVTSSQLQTAIPSMQREINFLSHGIRKLLQDHDSTKTTKSLESGDNSDIAKEAENFKRKREQLFSKQKETISGENVVSLANQARQLQHDTDLAIVLADKL